MDKLNWNIKDLCKAAAIDCEIIGAQTIVSGLQIDNREVVAGDLFFCIVGLKSDGHKFAEDAVLHGATALVVNRKLNIDVPQIIVEDTRYAMAYIADAFYGSPSSKMNVVGITGTNGKTTITSVVSHVLLETGDTCACIGTTGIKINRQFADPEIFKYVGRTTPESFQLQKMFYDLHNMNINNVVMEVSSHAIVQNRVLAIDFDVVAFTNLTQDHLDYHKTMDEYFEAKALLFSDRYPAKRVVCLDDDWGEKLAKRCKTSGDEIITTGYTNGEINSSNTVVSFPLIGKFNQQNMLISYAICKFLNIDENKIKKALSTTPSVEGRMQVVDDDPKNCMVVVDYAHTPDALQKAVQTLKEICEGKLITVFGCGGDRDKDKRPKMGSIAAKDSDIVIVTSDNPRSEDPNKIIDDIVAGMQTYSNYKVESDREKAIKCAIEMCEPKDIVLLAGKGHEKTQVIGDKILEFDDVKVARKYLK